MLTDKEAREQIIQITNELFSMGLLTCTGGNISALAEEPGTFWITPSQLYKGGLTQADLVRIRPDGTVLEGDRVPSVEYQMHWRAYEVRPDTAGAVHTHAPIATAFGICNQPFPPINTDAVFLRDTVTVPWYMPGSKELAEAVGEALTEEQGRHPAESRPDDRRPQSAQGRDPRHDARGDGQDRPLLQAIRRHGDAAARRMDRAAQQHRRFRVTRSRRRHDVAPGDGDWADGVRARLRPASGAARRLRRVRRPHLDVAAVVSPVLLELCRLRVAQILGCESELQRRSAAAQAAGLSEETIAALDDWRTSERFSAARAGVPGAWRSDSSSIRAASATRTRRR